MSIRASVRRATVRRATVRRASVRRATVLAPKKGAQNWIFQALKEEAFVVVNQRIMIAIIHAQRWPNCDMHLSTRH